MFATIKATCSTCGFEQEYQMDEEETNTLFVYEMLSRAMGPLQDVFPKVPAWIRNGAIDQFSGGFCTCPKCSGLGGEA